MLSAYVFSLVSNHKLAEDIAQQTLLIAYRKIDSLRDPAAFPAWLRGIARLEALSAMRKQGREFPVEPEALQQMDEVYRQIEEQFPAETWEERFRLVEECYGQQWHEHDRESSFRPYGERQARRRQHPVFGWSRTMAQVPRTAPMV